MEHSGEHEVPGDFDRFLASGFSSVIVEISSPTFDDRESNR